MRRFNPKYPVSSLLASSLKATSSHSLATALAYKNEAKMLRRLDEWLLTGKGDSGLISKLVDAGILKASLFAEASLETSRMHLAEEKALRLKTFRTHIYVQTERLVEGGFLIGLLASKVKYIFDDQLSSTTDENERLRIAITICQNHFSERTATVNTSGRLWATNSIPSSIENVSSIRQET